MIHGALSARDARILAAARRLAGGPDASFAEVARALVEATAREIPHGLVFHLGSGLYGPIVGSAISRVGITPAPDGRAQIVIAKR